MSLIDNIKEMEPKQKVTLVITALLFAFLVYLGYDTFFASDIPTPPAPSRPAVTTPPPAPTITPVNNQSNATTGPTGVPNQSLSTSSTVGNVTEEKETEPTPEELALLAESQELQKQYLKIVNEYQLVQLQTKLEQAKADELAAQLKMQQIQAQKEKFERDEKKISTQAANEMDNAGIGDLSIAYVGRRAGIWVAVLKNEDGSFFEVKEGTDLPDGSQIEAISSKGVVLRKGDNRQFLAMPKTI